MADDIADDIADGIADDGADDIADGIANDGADDGANDGANDDIANDGADDGIAGGIANDGADDGIANEGADDGADDGATPLVPEGPSDRAVGDRLDEYVKMYIDIRAIIRQHFSPSIAVGFAANCTLVLRGVHQTTYIWFASVTPGRLYNIMEELHEVTPRLHMRSMCCQNRLGLLVSRAELCEKYCDSLFGALQVGGLDAWEQTMFHYSGDIDPFGASDPMCRVTWIVVDDSTKCNSVCAQLSSELVGAGSIEAIDAKLTRLQDALEPLRVYIRLAPAASTT